MDWDAADRAWHAVEDGDIDEALRIINATACPTRVAAATLANLGDAAWVRRFADDPAQFGVRPCPAAPHSDANTGADRRADGNGQGNGEAKRGAASSASGPHRSSDPASAPAGPPPGSRPFASASAGPPPGSAPSASGSAPPEGGAEGPPPRGRGRGAWRAFRGAVRGWGAGRGQADDWAASRLHDGSGFRLDGLENLHLRDHPGARPHGGPEPAALTQSRPALPPPGPPAEPPGRKGPGPGPAASPASESTHESTPGSSVSSSNVATAQNGLATQHRTDITFGEYLEQVGEIAARAEYDKDVAEALAAGLGKIAEKVREMADDLSGDHNIAAAVTGALNDFADGADRMCDEALKCAAECELAWEGAVLVRNKVRDVYGADMAAKQDAGLKHASAAAHHD